MLQTILRFFGVEGDVRDISESLFEILENGVIVNPKPGKFVLDGGAEGRFVFRGDFDVEAGAVVGGTIEGFTAFVAGEKLFKASGHDIDYADFATALEGGEEVIQLLLGADKVFGSKDDDIIFAIAPRIKGGKGDDFIFGEFIDKRIKGEGGDDTIISGSGEDVLFGGRGRDVFVFRAPEDGVDDIRDFKLGKDKIGFNAFDFEGIGESLDDEEFVVGSEATTSQQRVIYDDETGSLYWDGDGAGGTGKVQLAKLAEGLGLTAGSFTVEIFV